MNNPRLIDFQADLTEAIGSIAASPRRKRIMREELLSHLLSSYQEELHREADGPFAVDAAIKRLGNVEELRLQLQATVPFFERLLFVCIDRKEKLMLRVLWIVGIVAWIVGSTCNQQLEFAGVTLFVGCVFWHLWQKDNLAFRLIGPRWPWFAGSVAVLFGTAIVLPAMAKIKHDDHFAVTSVVAMTLGTLIVLGGIAFIAQAIKKLHAPPG